jgi:hypothetical protein
MSSLEYLGCTISELRVYIESRFLPGMTWENHGVKGWHIDHIIPLSRVDLTDESERIKVLHYTNLQPMWASENLKKRNRLP